MKTIDRLLAFLDQRGVWFCHDHHPIAYTALEVAGVEHIPPRAFAKTVVVHSEQGYAMAVLPADRRVDLDDLRAAFGTQRLRLATEHELQELFPECELGAMPPFGNGLLYDLPVYADGSLLGEERIGFNAGTHRDVVRMRSVDWATMVKPVAIPFAHMAVAH